MTWNAQDVPAQAAFSQQYSLYSYPLADTSSDHNGVGMAASASMTRLPLPAMSSAASSSGDSITLQSLLYRPSLSAGLYSHGQLFDNPGNDDSSWQQDTYYSCRLANTLAPVHGFSSLRATPPPLHDLEQYKSSDSPSDSPSPLRAVSPDDDRQLCRRMSEDGSRGKHPQHHRRLTWTAGPDEGPNVSQEQKFRELQELQVLAGGGAASQKERRKIQNRFAQRAFRARSKVKSSKDMNRLEHLEETSEAQDELVDTLRRAIDDRDQEIARLQKENTVLRSAQWTGYRGVDC